MVKKLKSEIDRLQNEIDAQRGAEIRRGHAFACRPLAHHDLRAVAVVVVATPVEVVEGQFDAEAARALAEEAMPYAMGVPWWDYWLPLALLARGRRVLMLNRPAIMHLEHPANWSNDWSTGMAAHFARFVVGAFGRDGGPADPQLAEIVEHCRALLTVSEQHSAAALDAELEARRKTYQPPAPHEGSERGYLSLYLKTVNQADQGCDFGFLRHT